MTVAIPVFERRSGPSRGAAGVRAQRVDRRVELLVCDSGSATGREHCAPPRSRGDRDPVERFSHGGTRNLLMQRQRGQHVAFLTQDAVPAHESWLAQLLSGFELAPRRRAGVRAVPAACGCQSDGRARADRVVSVVLAPDGLPRIDRLRSDERDIQPRDLARAAGFFTDANGCVARAAGSRCRSAESRTPRTTPLAQDMLRAGLRQGVRAGGGRDPLARVLALRLAAAQLRRGASDP